MLNRPNKNYHRSEKIVSLHPPRNCVKNRIFPTGQKLQSIAACLSNKICTGEKGIMGDIFYREISDKIECRKLKASASGPNINLTDPHYNAKICDAQPWDQEHTHYGKLRRNEGKRQEK